MLGVMFFIRVKTTPFQKPNNYYEIIAPRQDRGESSYVVKKKCSERLKMA